MEEIKQQIEWMDADQSLRIFHLGFGRLMKLAEAGQVRRVKLAPDAGGNSTYLFSAADVRALFDRMANASR